MPNYTAADVTPLYAIPCTWSPEQGTIVHGLAICQDPDTVATFLYPSGEAYTGAQVWNYKLHHMLPWARLECRP